MVSHKGNTACIYHMRLPVVAAVAVPEPDDRGEVVLGPGSEAEGGRVEAGGTVPDPGVEGGQRGHVEAQEQPEEEAERGAERGLKLSSHRRFAFKERQQKYL